MMLMVWQGNNMSCSQVRLTGVVLISTQQSDISFAGERLQHICYLRGSISYETQKIKQK